jgi:hypothetical protein
MRHALETAARPRPHARAAVPPLPAPSLHAARTLGGIEPTVILALQRAVGNRGVQRRLGSRVRERAEATLGEVTPGRDVLERARSGSSGIPLGDRARTQWSHALGVRLPDLEIHADEAAGLIAAANDAAAVTIGHRIYLGEGAVSPPVLAHEMAHVAQAARPGPPAGAAAREHEARAVEQAAAQGTTVPVTLSASSSEPMAHPAVGVLKKTGTWLLRKTTQMISKHIARHGRMIAGRAIHSVFKNPREVRYIIDRTVREAIAIASRATRHGADEVLEEAGVRIFRQGTGVAGKWRLVVEKQFDRVIGTRGETVLRLIVDMSGRLVTAFPADRLLSLGLGLGAAAIVGARTAEASERIRERVIAEEERVPTLLEQILISPGSAGEGEDLGLEIQDIVKDTTADVIREIEEDARVSLGPAQREAIRDLVEVAIGGPMALEEALATE